MATISFNSRVAINADKWEEIRNSTPTVITRRPKKGPEKIRQKMLENFRKYTKEEIYKIPPENVFL